MIVKAAVARRPNQPVAIETLELDEPRGEEILVRLVASGVARADLDAIATGRPIPFPFVPGGEGAGVVERIGPAVKGIEPGDAVILSQAYCGVCQNCLDGAPRGCVARDRLNLSGRREDGSVPFTADGKPVAGFFHGQSSFSTHVLCHRSSAVAVPSETPLEVLAALGGEAFVAASALIHGFPVSTGDTIVITGAGASGLVATMAARALGATTIILADPDAGRRALASELGATLTAQTDDDLPAVVKSLTGAGVSFALETTGHAAALAACLDSLRPGGTCGLLRSERQEMPSADAVSDVGWTILDMSSGFGLPLATIEMMARWHAEGLFPIERLVAYFPFEHINDALGALAAEAVAKPIVRFSIGAFGDLDRAGIEGAVAEVPETEPERGDRESGEPEHAPAALGAPVEGA